MPLNSDLRIRLACKLKPEAKDVSELLEKIASYGWSGDRSRLSKGGLAARITGISLDEDELMLSVDFDDADGLDDLAKALGRECWYIDVYYHLRGELAQKAVESLGLDLNSKNILRMRESGVELKVELYPDAGAATISYRAGWGELNRGIVKKVHGRILGSGSRRGLKKLLRWGK